MEERIVELELRFTEQQALLGELSDVLYAQGKALERLEAEVAGLREKLAAEPGLVDTSTDERPPHY
jgi:SlyX protein